MTDVTLNPYGWMAVVVLEVIREENVPLGLLFSRRKSRYGYGVTKARRRICEKLRATMSGRLNEAPVVYPDGRPEDVPAISYPVIGQVLNLDHSGLVMLMHHKSNSQADAAPPEIPLDTAPV